MFGMVVTITKVDVYVNRIIIGITGASEIINYF